MTKLILPGSQDFREAARLVKVAACGLRGADLDQFVKRAGHQFADAVRRVDFLPGEVPIHLIAMGSTEFFGPNRNGDGFKAACLRRYHPTFVKFARVYRDHENKDTEKSYGVVKLSAYNERMQRVELLCALNGTKEAAARNKGLLADRELQKLANEPDNFGVSMACRVPFDVCSGCMNKAAHRGEYCTAKTCKYGGLAHNITKVAADGHVLHADNPDPTFFDISHVYRPADRIAWVLGQVKTAGAHVLGGAALAEAAGVGTPYPVAADRADPRVAPRIKLAHALAAVEDDVRRDPAAWVGSANRAFDPALAPPPADLTPLAKTAAGRAQAFAALAERKVILPPAEFLAIHLGDREKAAALAGAVAARLPGVYTRLVADDGLEPALAADPYRADGVPSGDARRWAATKAAAYSLGDAEVERRVVTSALRDLPVPTPAPLSGPGDDRAEGLAREYALYKLAAVAPWAGGVGAPRLLELAVRQNYVLARS